MLLRLVLAILLPTTPAAMADAQPRQAGFERQITSDGTEIGIWYPASGTPVRQQLGLYTQDVVPGMPVLPGRHPLVVISHGTGGDFAGQVDSVRF